MEPLYASGAQFFPHPFREHQSPREYAAWAFSEEASRPGPAFGAPIVQGNRVAVDWWGMITAHDGSVETIAGVSLLRFDLDGRVVEQRDTWATESGQRELPGWAAAGNT